MTNFKILKALDEVKRRSSIVFNGVDILRVSYDKDLIPPDEIIDLLQHCNEAVTWLTIAVKRAIEKERERS